MNSPFDVTESTKQRKSQDRKRCLCRPNRSPHTFGHWRYAKLQIVFILLGCIINVHLSLLGKNTKTTGQESGTTGIFAQ